jgi:hypothetical protein
MAPRPLDSDAAVADFLALGQKLQARSSPVAGVVVEELARWYAETRLTGTSSDEFTLQWEKTQPVEVGRPTDFRKLLAPSRRFEADWMLCISAIRFVDRPRLRWRAFGYDHVAMWCTLVIEPSPLNERRGFFSVDTAETLAGEFEAARREPLFARLVSRPVLRLSVWVDFAA